jgi:toxin FitB
MPFDERAALVWARLISEGRVTGRPRSDCDMIVASIAEVNYCLLVTENEKHFPGIAILNPLRARK